MRIAIVVPYFTTFYKQNEYDLSKTLVDLGHEVTLFTSNRKMKKFHFDAMEFNFGKRTEQDLDGFKVVRLPTLADVLEQPLMTSLGREVICSNPELVHVHEDFQNCSFLAFLAARESSIPLILSEERYYFPEGLWRLPYALYSSTFGRIVREGAAAITTHSNAAKDFLVSLGTESERIEVIPVGIDPTEFCPTEEETLTQRTGIDRGSTILTVARLHRNKGLSHLIRAMPRIIKENPSSRLIIIGGGPLKNEIEGLIRQLELEGRVVLLTNPIPNEEMNEIYPGCDVFVLPSIKEPFGRVILEAMACEKPVVATRVGGPLDIVEDGGTGYLVDRGNADQLADRIIELLHDRKKSRNFGRAGRKRVIDKFAWGKIAERYVDIYKSVQQETSRRIGV